MKQLKARDDSNAARKTSANAAKDPDGGGPERLGYTLEAYPGEGPATSNADVTITKDMNGQFNQFPGTSVASYKKQGVKLSSETGESGGK
jgi:hypothetical protein